MFHFVWIATLVVLSGWTEANFSDFFTQNPENLTDTFENLTDLVDNTSDVWREENETLVAKVDILIDENELLPGKIIDENEVFPERSVIEDLTLCNTTTGYVRGQTVTAANGKEVYQYLGIPFAEPPVGDLRFRKPVSKRRWEGVLDAFYQPNSCMQPIDTYLGNFSGEAIWNANTRLSEDCLYMNIWVPKPKPASAAVMVWIYGGGFFSGTITLDIYNGSILASQENIIVISIQYRLGPFGFFYFGTEEAPGNQGLYDQLLALKWIQDNAGNFGGHPKYVTLFGASAGAACVGLHLLSPMSSPLFVQAILQSGAPTADWASVSPQTALNRTMEFAHRLECPSEPAAAAMKCLRNVAVEILVEEIPSTASVFDDYFFNPVVDGEFLPKAPAELLKHGLFKRTNLLLGATANEGSTFLLYIFPEIFQLYRDVHLRRSDFVDAVFKLYPSMSTVAMEALVFQYTDWTRPDEAARLVENLEKIIGDKSITCHLVDLASVYASAGSGVFMYEFAHRSSTSPWPKWMGVQHTQEIEYVFGQPLNPQFHFTEAEGNLTRRVMTYWANFARTGNPSLSSQGEFEKRFWPVHTPNGKEYLHISMENEGMQHGLRANHCAFWKNHLPSLTKIARDMELAAAGARSYCTDPARKSSQDESPENRPEFLEVDDEWAMEFEEWRRDHVSWKKEFQKYVDTLDTARKLILPVPHREL